jgi:hypothetical protein
MDSEHHVVTAVSQNTRLDQIDQLQAEIDEGRARIRQRQEQREQNPAEMQDWLMDGAPSRSEAHRERSVQREGPAGDLVYKERPEALVTAAAAGEQDWSAWERWMAAHQANLKTEIYDALAVGMAEFASEYVSEKLAPLKVEIADLKRTLAERDERAKAIAEVKREVAGERVEREALQLASALAVRDAKIEKLETQVRMLCSFLSVSGVDLPKGL